MKTGGKPSITDARHIEWSSLLHAFIMLCLVAGTIACSKNDVIPEEETSMPICFEQHNISGNVTTRATLVNEFST